MAAVEILARRLRVVSEVKYDLLGTRAESWTDFLVRVVPRLAFMYVLGTARDKPLLTCSAPAIRRQK